MPGDNKHRLLTTTPPSCLIQNLEGPGVSVCPHVMVLYMNIQEANPYKAKGTR